MIGVMSERTYEWYEDKIVEIAACRRKKTPLDKGAVTEQKMTKSDEGETYASTTASPPPVQISLDDSIETEYKESQYMNSGGLISPNTDFSEEVCASLHIICPIR